jgi:hypothetical protein
MAIKVKINIDWEKVKEEIIRKIDSKVEDAFRRASNDAVNWAKTKHEFKTQTGALNSSIGFQLYKDGTLINSRFEPAPQETLNPKKQDERPKGLAAGKNAAEQRARELGAHICAVIVAGMPYAIYVESKGFDVLTSAYHEFPKFLDNRLKEVFRDDNIPYEITNG